MFKKFKETMKRLLKDIRGVATQIGTFVWSIVFAVIIVIVGIMILGEFTDMINITNTQANQTATEIINKAWELIGNTPLLLTVAFFGLLIAIVVFYFKGK